jgi:hypothetical protein
MMTRQQKNKSAVLFIIYKLLARYLTKYICIRTHKSTLHNPDTRYSYKHISHYALLYSVMDDIRGIVKIIVSGCKQGGVEVSEVLAAFIARTVLPHSKTHDCT